MEAISQNIPFPGEEPKKLLPWKQQPGEPDNAYLAFEYFINLGPGRTIADLAKYLKKPIRTLYGYSTQYNWTIRSKKYDFLMSQFNKNADLLELESRLKEMKKTRIEISLYASRALEDLALKMNDYWSNYKNPEVIQKINFLDKISRTMMRLLKLAEMEIPPEMMNEKCIRDITINDFFGLGEDLSAVELESMIATREHMRNSSHTNYPVKNPYRAESEPEVNIDDFLSNLRKDDSADFPLIE
jgi:hypothetical protein